MKQIEVDALKEKLDKIPARSIENVDGRAYALIRLSTVFEIIKQMPPAQPERKTGRWVSQKGGGYCCSECGRYALDEVDGNFIHVAFESNFCPYCGAKMVEK